MKKMSGLGLASVIASTLGSALLLIAIGMAGMLEASTPGGMDEESAGAAVAGLLLLAGGGIELLALVLGGAGLFQQERSKTLPIIGLSIAGVAVVGTGLLMLIGVVAG